MFVIIVFLWNEFCTRNHTVYLHEYALDNTIACIGYTSILTFYSYMYNIDMYCNINYSIKLLCASIVRLEMNRLQS